MIRKEKNIKICLVFMALALLLSVTLAQAYLSPPSTGFAGIELKADHSSYYSDWRTKTVDMYQHYYHTRSSTSWTPDCSDCIVGVDLYDKNGKISDTNLTVKGDYEKLADSYNKGDYYIGLWRVNPGIIKTNHVGTWYISTEK